MTDALRRYTALSPSIGCVEELRACVVSAAVRTLVPDVGRIDWSLIDAAHQRLASCWREPPLDRLERMSGWTLSGWRINRSDVNRLSHDLPDHYRVLVAAAHLHRQEGDEHGADSLIH